jgi:toxin ParE1/3/4
MAKLQLSVPAELDMVELWAFIAKDNLVAADRMVDRLNETFDRLARFPELGEVHPHPTREYRRIVVSPYVVIYQHKAEEVTIVRVFHSARKWEELL